MPDAKSIRNEVTEHPMRVAPALVGLPLARPWRRGAAMLVDGFAIVLLANAPGVLFAFMAVLVMIRATATSRSTGFFRRSARVAVRFGAALVLFGAALSMWERIGENLRPERAEVAVVVAEDAVRLTGLSGVVAGAEIVALLASSDEAEARRRVDRLTNRLLASGMSERDVLELLSELDEGREGRPWLGAAVDSVAARFAGADAARRAEVTGRVALAEARIPDYAAALAAGDRPAADRLRTEVGVSLAADTLLKLRGEAERERARAASLSSELAAVREQLEDARGGRGVLSYLRSASEDLGIGFGWAGLYFTAFLVLWNGRTPGKRLMRIRVVRLDGEPIGWWGSFERFGGYAAGLATGLLGFLQILWDRNRQGVHDQISRTVVIDG